MAEGARILVPEIEYRCRRLKGSSELNEAKRLKTHDFQQIHSSRCHCQLASVTIDRLFGSGKNRRAILSSGFVSARNLKALQSTISSSGPAATASYTLIGAIVLLGGIGYAIDEWRSTSPWCLFGGLVLGLIVGFYELAKTIWRS